MTFIYTKQHNRFNCGIEFLTCDQTVMTYYPSETRRNHE